jgi:hypothetical protein
LIPDLIKNLIDAHRKTQDKINFDKSLKYLVASKVATFAGSTYEMMRNAIELEQDHLLRRRAIHRILGRMSALENGEAVEMAEDLLNEIVWGKYNGGNPIPEIAIDQTGKIIQKFQVLIARYRSRIGVQLGDGYVADLYEICSFEIERLLVPYYAKDALINLQYQFLEPLKLVKNSNLPEKFESVQTYIAVLKTLVNFDNSMIKYYMFMNAFPYWGKPTIDEIDKIVVRIEDTLSDIRNHLSYKLRNKVLKEFTRQSIPLRILNSVIQGNLESAENILSDKALRDREIYKVCAREYSGVRKKIVSTTIKTMLYLAATKMIFALMIEVPYELSVHGEISYIPIAINLLSPPILMGLIASSFKIPEKPNTEAMLDMVDRYMDPSYQKYKNFGLTRKNRRPVLRFIFNMITNLIFLAVVVGITYVLKNYIGYNNVGVGIFILFVSLVSFGALKTRNIATDLIVIPEKRSIFTPLIDMVATPVLAVGKRLSEGVSAISPLPILFDYVFESPVKGTIRIIEEWNSYIKDKRDDVV